MRKRQVTSDPKLEAALDELDDALTPDTIDKILEDTPKIGRPLGSDQNLRSAAGRRERRDKRKR